MGGRAVSDDDLSFDAVAELARRTKVERTKVWQPGMDEQVCDLAAHVLVRRNDHTVALVMAGPSSGAEGMRKAVYIAAVMMRPTELYVVQDSVIATQALDVGAVAGVRAGDLVLRWRAGRREHLTEAIAIYRYDATGCTGAVEHRYARKGGVIVWGQVTSSSDGADRAGALSDHAQRGWADAAEVWDEAMRSQLRTQARMDGVPPEQEDYFTDRSCAAMASQYDQGMCKLLETGDTFVNGTELPSSGGSVPTAAAPV